MIVAKTAPELLAAEMPLVRKIEKELAELGYTKEDADYEHMFNVNISFYRKFGHEFCVKD